MTRTLALQLPNFSTFQLFNLSTFQPLPTDAELLDELLVARLVLALQVVEEAAAVLDLAEEAVAGRMVLLVRLEVGGERLDLLGENRDLDFGRTRVAVVTLEFGLDGGLVDLHFIYFFLFILRTGKQDPASGPDIGHRTPEFRAPAAGITS